MPIFSRLAQQNSTSYSSLRKAHKKPYDYLTKIIVLATFLEHFCWDNISLGVLRWCFLICFFCRIIRRTTVSRSARRGIPKGMAWFCCFGVFRVFWWFVFFRLKYLWSIWSETHPQISHVLIGLFPNETKCCLSASYSTFHLSLAYMFYQCYYNLSFFSSLAAAVYLNMTVSNKKALATLATVHKWT